jgi:hypothetical protein
MLTRVHIRPVVTTAVLAVALQAQSAQVDVTRLGPQVGARVADFSLQDQNGQKRSLESVAGLKGTMLVFFRSADW